jgi:hypothetical protein
MAGNLQQWNKHDNWGQDQQETITRMVMVGASNNEISVMIKSKTIKRLSKGWQW